jgi:large subunit ribosomal protein LP0
MPPKADKKDDVKAATGGDAGAKDKAAKGGKGGKAKTTKKEGEGSVRIKKEVEPIGIRRRRRKENFVVTLRKLIHEYKNILICTVDFVGSHQMQQVRTALRGQGVVLMGKNTVIRKILREEAGANQKLLNLVPKVSGNIGFVFTKGNLGELRKLIQANKKPAPAKVGNLAPEDVFIQPGPTGLDPGQTAFFQALNIQTKIAKGTIELITKTHLIKAGEKCTASHVSLLSKLGIQPFSYGMVVTHAYENGSVYEASILDMTQSDLLNKFLRGVRYVAALSLAVGFPTQASVPHSLRNAFRRLVALTFETTYDFPEAKAWKEGGGGGGDEAAEGGEEEAEEEEEAAEEEEEAESDGEIGGGLFGGDD